MDEEKGFYQIAEEAAYSFKGHCKTADWMKLAVMVYIGVPLMTSLVLLIFPLGEQSTRILSFLGLLFSGIAMNSVTANNREKSAGLMRKHIDLANKYLALYKDIRSEVVNKIIDPNNLKVFTERINNLDQETAKLPIGFVGRWWSKLRIKKEMDLGWIYDRNENTSNVDKKPDDDSGKKTFSTTTSDISSEPMRTSLPDNEIEHTSSSVPEPEEDNQ